MYFLMMDGLIKPSQTFSTGALKSNSILATCSFVFMTNSFLISLKFFRRYPVDKNIQIQPPGLLLTAQAIFISHSHGFDVPDIDDRDNRIGKIMVECKLQKKPCGFGRIAVPPIFFENMIAHFKFPDPVYFLHHQATLPDTGSSLFMDQHLKSISMLPVSCQLTFNPVISSFLNGIQSEGGK